MNKLYFLIVTFLTSTVSFGQATELYFSMYAEGSSNNKFLEIYNGTGADVDLSNYSISYCNNGCDTTGEFDYPDNVTFASGTTLANGDVYVIAHPSANAEILAEADTTFQYISNGDDVMALTQAGATANAYTIIDIIGDLQGDPGSGWAVAGVANGTQDKTLTRKSSVCGPNPNELGSFGTNTDDSEWIVGAIDSGVDELGSYTGCVSDPALNIIAPNDGDVIAAGTTSVDITIAVQNFSVGNPGSGVDGHIHWTVNNT
ncbi:MAG: lamin tail domain-containing protein, partial [Flavobacteriaceae bacterium]|nr:lamin tail domain-containing protein [Flavobacteriaceae bacterium]